MIRSEAQLSLTYRVHFRLLDIASFHDDDVVSIICGIY
jgi:hypothetical protein